MSSKKTLFYQSDQLNQGIKRSNSNSTKSPPQRRRITETEEGVNNITRESSIDENNDTDFDEMTSNLECVKFTYSVPYGDLLAKFFRFEREISYLYNKAEQNREICYCFISRVNAAMCFVKTLEQGRKKDKIFTREYAQIFNEFIYCVQNVKTYLAGISQLGKIRKYLKGDLIEQMYRELSSEFDGHMQSLQSSFIIQYTFNKKNEERIIADDVRYLKKVSYPLPHCKFALSLFFFRNKKFHIHSFNIFIYSF